MRSGFYANLNYRPWDAYWKYGYNKTKTETDYDSDGNAYTSTDSKFVGQRVYDVPALASRFIDAGVFLSITMSALPKPKVNSQ
jgi:hypothetical protein